MYALVITLHVVRSQGRGWWGNKGGVSVAYASVSYENY